MIFFSSSQDFFCTLPLPDPNDGVSLLYDRERQEPEVPFPGAQGPPAIQRSFSRSHPIWALMFFSLSGLGFPAFLPPQLSCPEGGYGKYFLPPNKGYEIPRSWKYGKRSAF